MCGTRMARSNLCSMNKVNQHSGDFSKMPKYTIKKSYYLEIPFKFNIDTFCLDDAECIAKSAFLSRNTDGVWSVNIVDEKGDYRYGVEQRHVPEPDESLTVIDIEEIGSGEIFSFGRAKR